MKNLLLRICCSISAFCLLPSAFAEGTNTVSLPISQTNLPNPTVSLLRVLGALILVIALFLGFVWLWRNWQRLMVRQGRAPKLSVLEARSLGGRSSLYVVGYEHDRFLVAASPAGVSLLSHLPQAPEEIGKTETPGRGIPFAQALAQVLKAK